MSQDRRLNRLEHILGATDDLTVGQRAIVDWLSIWRLTPQKRSYLQRIGREDLIERAEPLQDILAEPAAFLGELADRGIATLVTFLNHRRSRPHDGWVHAKTS